MSVKQTDKFLNILFLIQKLDEFRAFRRSNPENLRSYFMTEGHSSLFERIKPDLEKIAFVPEKIPGVPNLMKVAAVIRQLFPLCFISFVLAFLIKIGIFKILNESLYYFFMITPVVIMFTFVLMDQIARKMIVQYEDKHPDLHEDEKKNIKRAAEELLASLNKNISIYKLDPIKYRMRLYFDDYSGLEIESEYRERVMFVFKKKHSRFKAKPKSKR